MPDEGDLGWKISLPCTRAEARMLSEDSFFMASSDTVPTIVTREVDESQPDEWAIDVYFEARPDAAMLENIATLAPDSSGKPTLSQLGDEDWLVKSQQGLEPLRAGRFHIHTFDSPPHEDPAITNIRIDAGQAFGTGHHETTSGCLETLDHLRRHGKRYNNIIDVGTGTGLLAFAAHHLWPTAKIMASDIDQTAVDVSVENAATNRVPVGNKRGAVRFLMSNGLDHPAIQRRAPYDLIIANILAMPLIALASQISAAAQPGTILILAGLLEHQKDEVVAAYARAGFRVSNVRQENQWPCLTLAKTRKYGWVRKPRRIKSPLASDYFGEC